MTVPTCWHTGDSAFPPSLRDITSPPTHLYALGDRATLDAPSVAIVGTRTPTPYGERIAYQLASALASAGACVVSGLALGIDGCAHRAALKANGRTAAVLGAGIDQVYPSAHQTLYDTIAARGVVLSEFGPGHRAFKGCFPRRNRIIAGLAAVTIIVEAPHKSGALITANYALDAGRVVAAVPGPIESPQSEGANRLIRDGAQVITHIDDALALLKLSASDVHTASPSQGERQDDTQRALQLASDEAMVWDVLATPGLTLDDVIARTGWPANRCMAAVTTLEVQGMITCLLTGELRRQ